MIAAAPLAAGSLVEVDGFRGVLRSFVSNTVVRVWLFGAAQDIDVEVGSVFSRPCQHNWDVYRHQTRGLARGTRPLEPVS